MSVMGLANLSDRCGKDTMMIDETNGFAVGYADGERDRRNQEVGHDFSGLPKAYANGYRAGVNGLRWLPLTNSDMVTLVSDEDFDTASRYRWFLKSGYAATSVRQGKIVKTIWLHRLIATLAEILTPENRHSEIHHVNIDRLDNRRDSLEVMDKRITRENAKERANLFTVTYWDTQCCMWCVVVRNVSWEDANDYRREFEAMGKKVRIEKQ
jgi:hypothetical protein